MNLKNEKKLQKLNLSFNPLGDGASIPLTGCLALMPSLRSLAVEACGLADGFLANRLLQSSGWKRMEDIRIGMNEFSPTGVKSLIDSIDFSTIRTLSLAGINSGRLLDGRLETAESCGLIDIDLSDCGLTDSCVKTLARSLSKLRNLKRISFRNNIRLGIDALDELLCQFRWHDIHVEEIDLSGCLLRRSASLDNGRCVESLRMLLARSPSLRKLAMSFSRSDADPAWIDSFVDVWTSGQVGREIGVRRITDYHLILTAS